MRVAILSDIHGNLLALEAVLDDLAAAGGADVVVVAGDLCLGGPQPRETLARLRALGYPTVQGNTDRDLALPPSRPANDRDDLLDWTREQLGDEALAYLRALPFDHRVADPTGVPSLRVVHANPQNLDDHLRPYAPDARIAPLLEGLDEAVRVLAFGHLHIPFVREFGSATLANIASVGQPKDGDRRANYGLLQWDNERWAIEQRRVEYPVDEVITQLREAAPPGADELIKGLLRARYPNLTVARGGRPPKRRAAPKPAAVQTPQETEALVTQIATDPDSAVPTSSADASVAAPTPDVVAIGEPVAAEISVADGGTVSDESTADQPVVAHTAMEDAASDMADAAPEADEASASAIITSDADLAATPILPPDDSGPIADEPSAAAMAADVQGVADDESVATADVDLAYTEDEATPTDESQGPEEEQEEDAGSATDEPEDDEEEQEQNEESAAGSDRAIAKAAKKRRKRERKAAKMATQAESYVLSAEGSFPAALPALLDGRLGAVLSHLEAVRQDEDPEAVHDMRVATRRLRAALIPAERFYGAKTFRKLSRPVRDLARALGQVRDADVLLAYLRERYVAVANEERAGIEGLIDLIAADRAAARDDLDPILDRWAEDGDRAATFVQLAAKAKARGKKGRERVDVVAVRALERDSKQFEARAAILADEGASAEDLHDLRIAGKKLRYTIELFSSVLGDDAAVVLASLKSLQEFLGEIHDRDVLVELLAWERARALERQLHSLEFATFNPGTREERLQATRQLLDAPDSFGATAIGIYGLLIDATGERDQLEERLREEWGQGQIEHFVDDLNRLTAALLAGDDPAIDEPDDAAGEISAVSADMD